MNNSLSKTLRLLLFGFVFLFLIIVSVFFSNTNDRLKNDQVYELNDGWEIILNGDRLNQTQIPQTLDADGNDIIILRRVLSSDFDHEQTLLIRGSLQNVYVSLDGTLVYEKDFDANIFNTYASMYHFVNIPEASQGQVLEIRLISPYNNMSGTLNPVYYGTPSAIEDHLYDTHGFKVYISLFLLLISTLFTITTFIFFRKEQPYNGFLGLFGVFISLWLFAESRIVQFYYNNDFFIGALAYLSLASAPIAILAFIKSFVFKEDKYLFSSLCILFALNLLTVIGLHISGLAAFFQTVTITIILISISFVITLFALLKAYIHTKEKIYKNFLLIFIAFSFFLFVEVFSFLNKNFRDTAIFASVGISIILLGVFVINIVILSYKLRDSFEKQAYEEIAKTDQLTKAKSRFAFENDLDDLFYHSSKPISMVYFDFDDLKYINDHFGHIEGDRSLILGFSTIKQIFGDYGNCYRIGGDEFACVSQEIDDSLYTSLKADMLKLLDQINQDLPFNIRISMGYIKQNPSDDLKPSDLIQQADHEMYKDKAINKAQV